VFTLLSGQNILKLHCGAIENISFVIGEQLELIGEELGNI
jgi:hypothetical protein